MHTPRSVLVIGAHGFLGSTIARLFTYNKWQVVRGTRRPRRHAASVHVDLDRPDTVAAAIDGVDLVVNTVSDPSMLAERLVLQGGGRLVNVATIDGEQHRRIRNDVVTDDPRGTVVLNAGLAPGITNLVASELLDDHPEADSIEIVLSLSTRGMSGRAGMRFAHTNITKASGSGTSERRGTTATIPLPSPIGPRTCFRLGNHGDGGLGHLNLGARVDSYAYFEQPRLHQGVLALTKLQLLSALPLWPMMLGHRRPPNSPSREPVLHWVAVCKNGSRLGARTIRCQGDYLHAAAAALVIANGLFHPGTPAGCFNPEDLSSLSGMRGALAENGILVEHAFVRREDTVGGERMRHHTV